MEHLKNVNHYAISRLNLFDNFSSSPLLFHLQYSSTHPLSESPGMVDVEDSPSVCQPLLPAWRKLHLPLYSITSPVIYNATFEKTSVLIIHCTSVSILVHF